MSIGVVSGHSRAIISFMNGYLLKVPGGGGGGLGCQEHPSLFLGDPQTS